MKVQRQGIYETMSRDIAFLHRAVKLMPPINMAGLVDMNQVLDEMWVVAQEEMNFCKSPESMNRSELEKLIKEVEKKMKAAAADLNFEAAAELRDRMRDLRKMLEDITDNDRALKR